MSNTNEREDLIAGLREHATFMCIEGAERQRTLKAADMLEADLQDFEAYSKIIKSSTARERHTRETLRKLLANMQEQQLAVQGLFDSLRSIVEIMDSGDEHGEGSDWYLKAMAALQTFSNLKQGASND